MLRVTREMVKALAVSVCLEWQREGESSSGECVLRVPRERMVKAVAVSVLRVTRERVVKALAVSVCLE